MPLSPNEQQLLAEIERDLRSQDPQLAKTLTVTTLPTTTPTRFPLRRGHLAALVAALLMLTLVHAIAGEIHPITSAAITGGAIIPWLVSTARTRPRYRVTTARPTSRPDGAAAPEAGRKRREQEER